MSENPNEELMIVDRKLIIWAGSVIALFVLTVFLMMKVDDWRKYRQFKKIKTELSQSDRTDRIRLNLENFNPKDTAELNIISYELWLLTNDFDLIDDAKVIMATDSGYVEIASNYGLVKRDILVVRPQLPRNTERAIKFYQENGAEIEADALYNILDRKARLVVVVMIGENAFLRTSSYRS